MHTEISEFYALSVECYRTKFRLKAPEMIEKLLAQKQNHSSAFNLLGLILLDQHQYDNARLMFEKAIVLSANIPEYHNNLGALFAEQGQLQLAEQYFRQALTLNPSLLETLENLGYTYQLRQNYDAALNYYRSALQSGESTSRILVNIGKCLDEQGEADEAASSYMKAIVLDPQNATALNNLGNFHEKRGDFQTAIGYYTQSIASQPRLAFSHKNLGVALVQIGQLDNAIASIQNSLAIDPQYVDALCLLGDIYAYQGKTGEAAANYHRALNIKNLPGLRIRLAALLPAILESEQQITALRQDFGKIADLQADENLILSDPVLEIRDAFFYLSYHGLNNRDLKMELAHFLERSCPSLLWESPHCRSPQITRKQIKIGILSKYLYNHSIGKTTRGLFAKLPRERFHVVAIFIPPLIDDQISRFIRDHADEVLICHTSLKTAREQIASLELDILFYQDIGMDPFSYFLAFARLATVQCTSFGHPDTTGIRNMDYFISSELFEIETAQNHYSETLFCLGNASLPTYYYRPALPAALKPRAEFGLSDQDHIYLCPQALFKFHPAFDRILAAILRRDPIGKLVLLEGPVPHFAVLLRQRFESTLSDVGNRVMFMPPQNSGDFINLIAIADLMLDIPTFNGMNSSLEAFAAGTPVVTLPGNLQCSRHGAGLYRKMGVEGCIAENSTDYIDIALRLANNPQFRQQISANILANNHLLYEDDTAISTFSDFFEGCIEAKDTRTSKWI